MKKVAGLILLSPFFIVGFIGTLAYGLIVGLFGFPIILGFHCLSKDSNYLKEQYSSILFWTFCPISLAITVYKEGI